MNVWAILGPILAAALTWLGLRKKAEDWAEKELTKKAAEKFGVEWAIVKSLVDAEKRRLAVRQKRIAIVNKATGKRDGLIDTLVKAGFETKNIHFYTYNDMGNFNPNLHDVMLLDDFDGNLTDPEMKKIIDDRRQQFKFVVVTNRNVDFYSMYPAAQVKIIKNPAYIADNLEQMLL